MFFSNPSVAKTIYYDILCGSWGPHSDFGTRTSLSAEQEPGLETRGLADRM
jgi:hypothetical protein